MAERQEAWRVPGLLSYAYALGLYRRAFRFFWRKAFGERLFLLSRVVLLFLFGNGIAEKVGGREQVELVFEFHREVVQVGLFVIEFERFFDKALEAGFLVSAQPFVAEFLFVGKGKVETVEFLFVFLGFLPLGGCGFAGWLLLPFPCKQVGLGLLHCLIFQVFQAEGARWWLPRRNGVLLFEDPA